MPRVLAIVPLKALNQAKGRLAPELAPGARRDLAAWMLGRVLAACQGAAGIDEVLVVAGDTAGVALAEAAGARAVLEARPGLPAAMATADTHTGAAAASLVVAADLPLAEPEDLEAVLRAGARGPCVVVAPTRDGGTGALLRRPAGVIATAYGPGSARAHLELAQVAEVPGVLLELPRLAMDVDTPAELAVLRETFPGAARGA